MTRINSWQTLAIATLTCMVANAQQPKSEEPPPYQLSFVTVGSRSDAYWVGDGPDMEVRAQDPGATPPPNVFLKHPKKVETSEGKKSNYERLKLALNIATTHYELKGNTYSLFTRHETGEDSFRYSAFTSSSLPSKPGPYTVFLARKPKNKTWATPQQVVLSDSPDDFPPGSARFVNLSDRAILVQLDDNPPGRLQPGKGIVLKDLLQLKDPKKLTVWYSDRDRKLPALRRPLRFSPDTRINITCAHVPKRTRPVLAQIFSSPFAPVLEEEPTP